MPTTTTKLADTRTAEEMFVDGKMFHAYSVAHSRTSLDGNAFVSLRAAGKCLSTTHLTGKGYRVRQTRNGICWAYHE